MLASATPITVNWQGRLLDTDGSPINGPTDVELVLYQDAVTTTAFHTETADPLTLVDGFISVRLGAELSNPLQSEDFMGGAWVQVRIDDVDLGARTELVSVPYAGVAAQLDGVARLADTSVSCSGDNVGTLRFRTDTFEGCTSAGWQSLVTADSAGDVAIAGSLGVDGSVAVAGSLSIDGAQSDARSYDKLYHISTSVTEPLLDSFPSAWSALVVCSVTGTGTHASSMWMLKRSTSAFVERVASFGSVTSNTPEIYIDSGTFRIRLYSHGSLYNTRCHFEEII
jgi:hypothetical protein